MVPHISITGRIYRNHPSLFRADDTVYVIQKLITIVHTLMISNKNVNTAITVSSLSVNASDYNYIIYYLV